MDRDNQMFPADGREAFVYALIPHLAQERPGKQFEFYLDAALLASRPQRCTTLLLEDALRESYTQAMRGLDWLQFPDDQRIRPRLIRETLQRKQIVFTNPGTGATKPGVNRQQASLPYDVDPLIQYIFQAGENLELMQRDALGHALSDG